MSAHEEQDPWVFFVHGTSTRHWDRDSPINPDQGQGEFGVGFYVFEDTGWGRRSAASWAQRKADEKGGLPILVRLKIRRSAIASLDREDVGDDSFAATYNRLHEGGRAGKQLIVGPVSRRGREGGRVPNRSLPWQFKFEGSGVLHLTLDEIVSVE